MPKSDPTQKNMSKIVVICIKIYFVINKLLNNKFCNFNKPFNVHKKMNNNTDPQNHISQTHNIYCIFRESERCWSNSVGRFQFMRSTYMRISISIQFSSNCCKYYRILWFFFMLPLSAEPRVTKRGRGGIDSYFSFFVFYFFIYFLFILFYFIFLFFYFI